MNSAKHIITWFDIPVTDMDRAVTFYSAILEVELQQMTFSNGLRISVFSAEEGAVTGALSCFPEHYIPAKAGSLVYINGNPDLQKILDRIEPAGGKILMPKSLISEHWGHMALFEDTEGNRVALHSNH